MGIQGITEGYIEEISHKTLIMPSEDSAKLFIAFCQGIDSMRQQSYRFDYVPKRKRKGQYEITIRDIGE